MASTHPPLSGAFFMAENKKSFLLYCDLIHTIEQLTDEQAGDLFKHILRYVNDQDPEAESVITKIAFEPIKQQLKRDLQKYEQIRERNSANARKRWDATAYDRIPDDAKNADNVTDKDTDTDKVIKKFIPPTKEEINQAFPGFDADRFIDFYTSKGWVVGKTKMKDWKAAVRNWQRSSDNKPDLYTPKYKKATL
jgi:hypothetical protein